MLKTRLLPVSMVVALLAVIPTARAHAVSGDETGLAWEAFHADRTATVHVGLTGVLGHVVARRCLAGTTGTHAALAPPEPPLPAVSSSDSTSAVSGPASALPAPAISARPDLAPLSSLPPDGTTLAPVALGKSSK